MARHRGRVGTRVILNPVVRGFAPDPSICRVGSDYFLATSSLDWSPGIPIRHSTDLVHWSTIGHAVTRPAQYRRDRQPGPLRLYAPTLRHHDGMFHLACTNVSQGQGNFLISAADPAGPWSDAVWVDQDAFDPSLTFDGDVAYFTRRTIVPGKEGSGPIVQAQIDVETGRMISSVRRITPGEAGYRSNDIEAPHLFRIGGWWYLLGAEGGTWKGHMATIARSRSPWGPFEGFEGNPILTHRQRVGHPIQSTGHADIVDDEDGRWWAVFLGTRHHNAASWHHLGREVFLAPVTWQNEWPIIGSEGTVELNEPDTQPLPGTGLTWPHESSPWTAGWMLRDGAAPGITIRSQNRGGPGPRSAVIDLPRSERSLGDDSGASAAFVRQTEYAVNFEAVLENAPPAPGRAGVTVFATAEYRYDFSVSAVGDGHLLVSLDRHIGGISSHEDFRLPHVGPATLRINATPEEYRFSISGPSHRGGDSPGRVLGSGLAHLLAGETTLTYYGVSLGVFAQSAAVTLTTRG